MSSPSSMYPPDGTDPGLLVRTMQIICGALMMGVVMFAVVAVVVHLDKGARPAPANLLIPYFALGMAVTIIIARVAIPTLVVRASIKQLTKLRPVSDIRKLDLYAIYQQQMIVGCALLEGAAFFNLIAFIIEGQLWSLGVVGALMAIMVIGFPTRERVDAWADDQLRQLQLNNDGF